MNKLIPAVVGLMLAVPASAQTVTPTGAAAPAAAAADVATVDAIIAALYDVISGPAGQARDWNRFRSLFVSEARLVSAGVPRGGTMARARVLSIEDYVEASGPLLEERGFFEREIGRVTERFENMVHAFSTYESRSTADGAVFQRGMNSIQLLHDGERWWIVTVMWWGVGPDFTISEKYLSKPS
jgi:hypothetical protein